MKSLILSILVVVALGRFPAIVADVDVYLLGGQSNMQGQGSIADLTGGQRQLSNKVYLWNGRQFGTDEDNSSSSGISSDKGWRSNVSDEERPLSDLYLTMLQRLGVETDSFGGSKTTVSET